MKPTSYIKKEVCQDETIYELEFIGYDFFFVVKITEKYGYLQWQCKCELDFLKNEDPYWGNFKTYNNLLLVLNRVFENNLFSFILRENECTISFNSEFIIADKIFHHFFSIYLKKEEEDDISQNKMGKIFQILTYISKNFIENSVFSNFISKFEALQNKVNDLDIKVEENIDYTKFLNEKINKSAVDVLYKEKDMEMITNNICKLKGSVHEIENTLSEYLGDTMCNSTISYLYSLNILVNKVNNSFEKVKGRKYSGVMINHQIPDKGTFSYKFKIEKTQNSEIMIGLGLKNEDGSSGFFRKNCHMFSLEDSRMIFFRNNLSTEGLAPPKGKQGDVFTLIIDMSKKEIILLKNNEECLGIFELDYEGADLLNLYPCIDLKDEGDRVSFSHVI
jgi:hypothetical protein